MEAITKVLYWISTGLMIPVILLLLFFFVRALILMGTFYSMYVQKLRFNKDFRKKIEVLTPENLVILEKNVEESKLLMSLQIDRLMKSVKGKVYYDRLLNEMEIEMQKDLSGSQTLAKLGPVLGLMGTLIPMGPALVGLASGDIASMASHMQVAFATTVIGLFIGAVGFVIMQIKKRWFASDMNDLEFIAELLLSKKLD
jgi:biopolymer transport protein ExbB/TolQ